MGLFGLAIVLGAILHLFWPDKADQRTQGERARTWFLWLLVGLLAYTVSTEWTLSPTRLLEALGHGDIGRFVLGLTIGFAVTRAVILRRVRRVHTLWLGLTTLLLAVAAPHVDKWLSNLDSFKASGFEVKFGVKLAATATANYKVAVAESAEAFASHQVFAALGTYDERIYDDLEFVRLVEMPAIEKMRERGLASSIHLVDMNTIVEKLRKLHYFFRELVSPLANCYLVATPSMEQLRAIVRPVALDLQELVYDHADPAVARERSIKFWRNFTQVAEEVDKVRTKRDAKCGNKARAYHLKHEFVIGDDPVPGYPRFDEFSDLPYLYVASAALMAVLNDSEAGLAILKHGKSKIGQRVDYFYLVLETHFLRSLGYPAAETATLYSQWKQIAIKRQRELEEQCGARCEPSMERLRDRHRRAEILAANSLVYHVSEDLARGVTSARRWETVAERHASELKKSIDSKEVTRLLAGYYYDILDTYAYARIVAEAQKTKPDPKIFKEMQRELQGVVNYFAQQADEKPSKFAYWQLNAARTHYNSARELSGE